MRGCGARLVRLLVLSLAWLGPALGGQEEDGEVAAEEEEEDEVLSDELREEDSVLVLHEHNFARALSEHRLLLVEFCKCPRCGQGCGLGARVQNGARGQRWCGQGHGHRQGQGCGSEGQGHRTWYGTGQGLGAWDGDRDMGQELGTWDRVLGYGPGT